MINNKHLCNGNNISVYSKPSSDKTMDHRLCMHVCVCVCMYVCVCVCVCVYGVGVGFMRRGSLSKWKE
jgi:hypothetical protein